MFLKCAVISIWRYTRDNIIFCDCAVIQSFEREFDNVFLKCAVISKWRYHKDNVIFYFVL